MAAEANPDFVVVPPQDDAGRYVLVGTTATSTAGYGRLLPLLNVYRRDKRFVIRERDRLEGASQLGVPAVKTVTVHGPCSPDDVENRFVLPDDLEFRRHGESMVFISDPDHPPNSFVTAEIDIEFRPPRAKWWQSR